MRKEFRQTWLLDQTRVWQTTTTTTTTTTSSPASHQRRPRWPTRASSLPRRSVDGLVRRRSGALVCRKDMRARGPLQSRYNYRLTTLDTTALETPLRNVFQEQTNAFKINLSYAFVLRNKNTDRYRYYHASCNCCGRYLDEPSLVVNSKDFDEFLVRIREADVLQWAINQRPDSAWDCELVTNATFFVNRIIDHPIGCVGMIPLPDYIKKNKAVVGLEADPKCGKRYGDNLCLFRCLALQRGCDLRRLEPAVKTLYEAYAQDGVPMEKFAGISVKDLHRVETTFQTNVCV